jgi:hypothetical protein
MERRETVRSGATHIRREAGGASTRTVCVAATVLGAFQILAVPVAFAEPAALPPVSAPPPARALQPEEPGVPAAPTLHVAAPPERTPGSRPELGALLVVPGADPGAGRPQTTDELLARAVALGTNPDLEPPSPFRKKSRDLFQTERPVSIGDQELLMRLRLRAKAREAVSVEFRF